jgi:aryl-alcohol dehydrogenase-like predicted oxidoreductase
MQYARMGNTGLVVSRLAFGVMTFGSSKTSIFASISKVDQKLAVRMVRRSIDAGINLFNTADIYTEGQSEEFLGKALGASRADVIISTKCGFRTGPALIHQGLSRHHIIEACEDSLRRLGTDYIDIYLVHRPDPFTPVEETVEALDSLVKQGKIRYVGYSNWPAWMAATGVGLQEKNGWAKFCAAEMYYSLVGRDLELDIVPFLEHARIGTLIWSPLAGGLLTGKYTRSNPKGDGGRLATLDFLPFDKTKAYEVVDKLIAIAKAHNASPAQVALAWLLSKRGVTTLLIGANKMAQLDDNLAAVDLQLSTPEITALDELTAPALSYPHWFGARVVDVPVRDALSSVLERVR